MKKMALLLFALSFTTVSFCQTDSTIEHAKQLLKVTGTVKLATQMMSNMMASYQEQMLDVPKEFWTEFMNEVKPDDLINLIVPIYVKYYTDEDLVQLIAFYNSPLGQKLVQSLPLISQESFSAGQEWGKKLGEKVVKKLRDKGYKE